MKKLLKKSRIWKLWKWIPKVWFDIWSVSPMDVTALCNLYWDSDFISFRCCLFESLIWRAWQRISILLFLWAQLLLIQWNCSSLNQVYKTSQKWMIMTDSIMLSKVVFYGKYPTYRLSQLRMKLMSTYQHIVHLVSIVELGPTSFVDYCIYKVSRMFWINILQTSLELEAQYGLLFWRYF